MIPLHLGAVRDRCSAGFRPGPCRLRVNERRTRSGSGSGACLLRPESDRSVIITQLVAKG